MSSSTFSTWSGLSIVDSDRGIDKQDPVFKELYEQFGVPFVLVDQPALPGQLPLELPLQALEVVALAQESQSAQVEQLAPELWCLAIPVWREDRPAGVAVARIVVPSGGAPAPSLVGQLLASDACTGAAVLRRWAEAVARQMRTQPQCEYAAAHQWAHATLPAVLTLLHGATFQRRSSAGHAIASLLAGVCETLQLESLAWIPANPGKRPMLAGAIALDPAEYRRLIARTLQEQKPTLPCCWLTEVQEVRRHYGRSVPCLIVASAPSRPAGWLVASGRGLREDVAAAVAEALCPLAAALGNNQQFATLSAQFKDLLLGLMKALTAAIDAKDDYTRGHSHRVAKLAVLLGQQLGLEDAHCSNLYLAGLLHDIGKIGIDDQVLKKPGPLTPEERQHIMSHVEIGVAILEQVRWFKQLIPGVRHHHERFDGKGYPDGVAGEQISMDGRILAVADAFDAMYSDRAYRRKRSPEEIYSIFQEGAGTQWDPRVIQAAFQCWGRMIEIQDCKESNSLIRAVEEAVRSGQNRFATRSMALSDGPATAVHAARPHQRFGA